jgi:hypothetical protein
MNGKFNHVMLDIETLGQGANAVITSIAAIAFDITTGQTGKTFHTHVDVDSCVRAGLDMEVETIKWWFKQSDAARNHFLEGQKRAVSLVEALSAFRTFMSYLSVTEAPIEELIVWGRGPRFDHAILTTAYTLLNVPLPWNFRNEMCVRTMEWLRPGIKEFTPKVDTGHGSDGMGSHDAIKDAYYQIAYVSGIFQNLNEPTKYVMSVDPYHVELDKDAIITALENVERDNLVLQESKVIIKSEPNDQEAGTQLRLLFNSHYNQ